MKNENGKANEGQKTIKLIIIGCILAALLVGFYYYLSHKTSRENSEDVGTITKTQQVLLRNLDANYPPTPKEVVKYYCDITQCFYNETNTEEEIRELAMQIQKLYDDDLIANQTQDGYMQNLITDIISMNQQGLVVSSYSTSASTDVEEFSEDGYQWARLYCNFVLRQETTLINTNEQFLLRKDENGHWKIYGWQLVE